MASNSGTCSFGEYSQVLICPEDQRKGKSVSLKQEGKEIRYQDEISVHDGIRLDSPYGIFKNKVPVCRKLSGGETSKTLTFFIFLPRLEAGQPTWQPPWYLA